MIRYIRPVIIILFSLAIAYMLYWLGQIKPQPVEESNPVDVEVEIVTPTNHQI